MPRSAADRSAGRAVGSALAVCALACVLVGPGSPRALGATAGPSAAGPTRSADVPDEHLTASVRGLDTAGSVLTIDLADAVSPLHTEERRDDQLVVTISADVLFAFDSADLTDVARAEITKLAPRVRPGTETVTVRGHTDKLGTPAYNVMLSQRRADAVARVLRSLLPGGTRVSATGRGGADPVAPNSHPDGSDDPDGRALNRRVQISFPAS
ncbi:flagellar motor protein MotB [Frankia sp. R43]|uniref:OmpA family protein n=1 Tax=Frankia sp. R43 TaxID=269536 RepID=UPI0006CA0764|nr:OmpA family protein [Frankia sp. R43]KPM52801.1 flagellar motor protein MotB [Frankia sp. R43]